MTNQRWLLLAYCVFALVINQLPWVSIPFIYLTTVFHELSHGIAALVTGGSIVEFSLSTNGAGHVISRGGIAPIIAFSGYFGAALWGGLLYQSARYIDLGRATLVLLIFSFVLTLVLWVNTLITAAILVLMIGLLSAVLIGPSNKILKHVIRFIAVIVLFNAIYSPLYLLGSSKGDSVLLADLLLLPELFWVAIWLCWGLFVLYKLFKSSAVNTNFGR